MEEIGVTNSQKLFVCNLSTVTSITLEIHVILTIFLFKRNENLLADGIFYFPKPSHTTPQYSREGPGKV